LERPKRLASDIRGLSVRWSPVVGLRRCQSATGHRGAPVNARAGSPANRTSGWVTMAGRGDAERGRCPRGAAAVLCRSFTSSGRTDAPEVGLPRAADNAVMTTEARSALCESRILAERSRTCSAKSRLIVSTLAADMQLFERLRQSVEMIEFCLPFCRRSTETIASGRSLRLVDPPR